MTNIGPELFEQIMNIFNAKYEKATLLGKPISDMLKKLEAGEATFVDADMYATKVGTMYSEAMREVLVLENMPNQTLYYNIAKQTIEPSLQKAYNLISNVATSIQDDMNHAIGVNLKAAVPEFDSVGANVICNNAAKAKTQEELDAALTEPVKTHCKRVVDSTQRKNAELHNKAGLKVRVSREYDGVGLHRRTKYAKVCSFCWDRRGTNETYENAIKKGMFQRHDGCGCLIEYTSEKGKITYSNGKNSGWSDEKPGQAKNPKEKEENVIDKQVKKSYSTSPAKVKELEAVYNEDVKQGWISPNSGFANYLNLYNQIQKEIVGKETVNGIRITEQSRHFLQRVIGTMVDPQKLKEDLKIVRRSGVEINDIKDALFSGTPRNIQYNKNGASQLFLGKKCKVTINPETGKLIQCNPIGSY